MQTANKSKSPTQSGFFRLFKTASARNCPPQLMVRNRAGNLWVQTKKMESGMKPVTNNTLKALLIISIVIGLIVLAVTVGTKETIQLTASEDGKVFTGETKRHWRFKKS
jgi:hypothetical protein